MDIDDNFIDKDSVSYNELKSIFGSTFKCEKTKKVAKNREYILQIASNGENHDLIAASLSNKSVVVCDAENYAVVNTFKKHEKEVTGTKFSNSNPKLLYTSSLDGFLYLWDLRKEGSVPTLSFSDESTTEDGFVFKKALQSFDVDLSDRLLCAGTEQIAEDSFVLFWDIRKHTLLGGYWEIHSDDVTQVAFHHEDRNLVSTASLDGLVNVCDVTQAADDALQYCLNTEFPIARMKWVTHSGNAKSICVASDEDCVQLWKIDDGKPYLNFTREELPKAMRRVSHNYCYTVDVHEDNDSLFLLCGSNSEESCLRTLTVGKKSLKPRSLFESDGNPFVGEEMIRTSLFNKKRPSLLTGGEDGELRLWTLQI